MSRFCRAGKGTGLSQDAESRERLLPAFGDSQEELFFQ